LEHTVEMLTEESAVRMQLNQFRNHTQLHSTVQRNMKMCW